jgi:hypothetical protein
MPRVLAAADAGSPPSPAAKTFPHAQAAPARAPKPARPSVALRRWHEETFACWRLMATCVGGCAVVMASHARAGNCRHHERSSARRQDRRLDGTAAAVPPCTARPVPRFFRPP